MTLGNTVCDVVAIEYCASHSAEYSQKKRLSLLSRAMCMLSVRQVVVSGDPTASLSLILSQSQRISLTQNITRWMQFIDQLSIINQNIDAH